MDGIDDATLKRMLALAALEVADDAREALRQDLGRVLDSMSALREAGLQDVPPTYGVATAARVRPDEPVAGLDRAVALGAAPATADDCFVLPSAMGGGGKGE